MSSTRRRASLLAVPVLLALALLAAPHRAHAQFLGYGGYGMGYPGMMGYGLGYGMGYPGMMGYGLGYGGYGMGYPGMMGYGGLGYGGMMGYGGLGYGGLGYGGYGYPFGNFFGYAGYGMAGYYYPFWNNPASLSLGITPLALQSALMERGLRTTSTTNSVLIGPPQSIPLVLDAPANANAPNGSTVFSGPPQRLPAGTYRVEIIRIDPDAPQNNHGNPPAANP